MSRQFTRTLRLLSVATLLCWSFLSPAFSASISGAPVNHILCPGATRNVTNSKSLNSNQWDDVGVALSGLFSNNSNSSWLFAPGTTFVENTDGTARLTGTLNVFGYPSPNQAFAVDITFIGQTYTPPTGSPENRTGVPTTGWYYYHWGTAKLTGLGDLAGGVLTLTEHTKAFQLGIGANQAPEATDMTANGASGWFEWTIVSQPTTGPQFLPYNPGYSVGDVAIILSGPPTICVPVNPCPDITGNTISKSCVNYTVVLSGPAPTGGNGSYEYMWLKSTSGCPTDVSQAIPGATGPSYTLPSTPTVITYFVRCARQTGCTTWGPVNESNCVTVNPGECSQPNPCPNITGNTISKSCVNYAVVLSGPAPTGGNGLYEYMWLKSTSGCPTDISQAIPGATGLSYTLPSTPTVVTYFVRCARQTGCTIWGPVNESNCVTVNPGECSQPNPCPNITGNTISKSCVNYAVVLSGPAPTGGNGSYEYMWLKSTSSCPTDISQAIPGATGPSYTLPSTPTVVTYFVRCARQTGCTTWGPVNESNCVTVNPGECSQPNPCPNITGNTISKSCVNYAVVLSGPAPTGGNGSYEYMWLKSTSGCPTDISQAIAGATGPSYTLPSTPTVVTYFVRCARQTGCTTWGPVNESNCVTVNPGECSQPNPCPNITGNTISKSCVNYAVVLSGPAPTGGNGSYEYMWLKSTSGCPSTISQAIAGATGLSYTLPSTPTVVTYFVRCARQTGCTTWGPVNESNCIKVNPGECARPNPCDITIGGNTISKTCTNGVPVLSGPTPTGGSGPWEYLWLSSTWGCPTDMSQAIAGATGPTYTLPSSPSKITYFVRCARQVGCTTWGASNESNCVTVNANECKVTPPQCYDYDVSSTKDYCGSSTGSSYTMYLNSKSWGNSNFFTCESLVFEQQTNGTATLKGGIRSAWWDYIYVNVTFTGGTTTPPSGSPKLELCADSHTNTNGWVYYTGMSGSIKFNNWKTLSISRRGPAFQVGQGADLQDKNLFGASGWFTLSDGTQGDFNFRLGNQRACGSHWDDLQSAVSLNMNAFADYRRTNIEWTNNSGQNNDYFAVQKLSDAGNFDDLEVMSAYASTPDVQYYQTYDNAPVDGDNFYRVKLTLRDGTVKYSDIKKVTFKNLNGVNVFPNPADDHVDIDLTNYAGKDVTIYVYDQLGYQRSINRVNNVGAAPYRVNLENANAGSYLVRIVAAGKRDVVKQVTVQK